MGTAASAVGMAVAEAAGARTLSSSLLPSVLACAFAGTRASFSVCQQVEVAAVVVVVDPQTHHFEPLSSELLVPFWLPVLVQASPGAFRWRSVVLSGWK